MTWTRQIVRRILTLSVAGLTAILAAFAVFVAVQSGPTATVVQARAELTGAAQATGVTAAVLPDVTCRWFGLDAAPRNGKVSPQVSITPDLDAAAARLVAAGWTVERSGAGLVARGPCVWPEGERRPAP